MDLHASLVAAVAHNFLPTFVKQNILDAGHSSTYAMLPTLISPLPSCSFLLCSLDPKDTQCGKDTYLLYALPHMQTPALELFYLVVSEFEVAPS
jgi:hypothetical protein